MIITISRQTGSLGEEIASELSRTIGLQLIDREFVYDQWFPKIAKQSQLNILKESPRAHLNTSSEGIPFYLSIENRLKDLSKDSSLVILGLGAQVIFQENAEALHIRIISPESIRINRICQKYGIDFEQASKLISLSDRKHRKYLNDIYSRDWEDNRLYHITLNTGKLTFEQSLSIITKLLPGNIAKNTFAANLNAAEISYNKREFVHQSEIDFVKILNMYNIEWKYEPTTFPIEWDAEGNVSMAFTPDFFLPAYQTYVELTTMNQKYVTEKNKKMRKLRALYPNINITILYKKDINKLLKKFGVV